MADLEGSGQVEHVAEVAGSGNVTPPSQEATMSRPEVTDEKPKGLARLHKKIQEFEGKSPVAPKPAEKAPKEGKTGSKTAPALSMAAASVPPAEGSKAAETPPIVPAEGAESTVEPVVFKPNTKFKVLDKEYDIDPRLASVMKDAESEKMVRELHEKAFGLDVVKPKLQAEKQARAAVEQEKGQILGQIGSVKEAYKRDLGEFFDMLSVDKNRVVQWVADQIRYEQLPPEQKARMDAQRDAETRARNAESTLSQTFAQQQQTLATQVQQTLQSTLARADVKAAAELFDARAGRPGAFEDEIRRRGHYAWSVESKFIPPDQVANDLMILLGATPAATAPAPSATATQAAQAAPAAPAAPVTTPSPQRQVPVLPNVSGRSASPLKTKPRNLADLRKIAAEMRK